MNDTSRCSKKLSFVLFADDTKLFYSHKNVYILYNTLNQELINITSWLSCNKLSLNVKKTHFMVFETKRKKLDQAFEIKINDQQIEKVQCTKFVRIMTFSSYQEKSKPLFRSLKILDRYKLNKYLIALLMYSYFSNNLPKYFNKYFILIKNIIVMILVQHQKYLLITKGQF